MPPENSPPELATIVSTVTSRPQTVATYTDTLLGKRAAIRHEMLTPISVSESIAEGQKKSGAAVAQLLMGIVEIIRSTDPMKQSELQQKLDALEAIDHQPFLLQGNSAGPLWDQLNKTPKAFGQVLSRRNKLETDGQLPLYLDSQQVVLSPLYVLQQLYRGRIPSQFFHRSDKEIWGMTVPTLTDEDKRCLDVPVFALTEEDRADPTSGWFLPEGRRFKRYLASFSALKERKYEDAMTCANSLMRGGFHGDRGALAYKAASFKCLNAGNLPPATMRELEKCGGSEADITAILAAVQITEQDFVRAEPKQHKPLSPFERSLQQGYEAIKKNENERAIQAFHQTAKLNRKDPRPHFGRAVAYLGRGDVVHARQALEQGEELAGDALYPDASYRVYDLLIERGNGTFEDYAKRAEAAYALGMYGNAVSDCQQIIDDANSEKNVPVLVTALNLLAWVRATCPDEGIRNGAEAVQHAIRALGSSPTDEWLNDTLAAAFAEAGNFPEAMGAQMRAMTATQDAQLLAMYRQRLHLYEANTPFRETKPVSSANT